MKLDALAAVLIYAIVSSHVSAQVPSFEKELSGIAEKLAVQVRQSSRKKITVLDFMDLQGNSTELGRFLAQQISVRLFERRDGFSVIERANLKTILAEHKLTVEGLVEPENAKKLGQFLGVDAIVLGSVTPLNDEVAITAKIIATDTAEMVGAATARISKTEAIAVLSGNPIGTETDKSTENASKGRSLTSKGLWEDEKPQVVKTLGDFRVEVPSLKIVSGTDYLLSLNITNLNLRKTLYVALAGDGPAALKTTLNDPEGFEFVLEPSAVTGLAVGSSEHFGWWGAVKKIGPGESVSATVKYAISRGRAAKPGKCRLQVEFLDVTLDGYGKVSSVTTRNLTCNVEAVGSRGAE